MDPKHLMLPAAAGLGIHEPTASTSSAVPQNVAPSDTVSQALATISDLLPNPREYPRRKSHARKKSPGHIPRPAYVLTRPGVPARVPLTRNPALCWTETRSYYFARHLSVVGMYLRTLNQITEIYPVSPVKSGDE